MGGTNVQCAACHLGVNPQSVANRINAAAANLPAPPFPKSGRRVSRRWDWAAMQPVVDDAPPPHRDFSDGFPIYVQLLYSGQHRIAPGKSETFSIEGDNAEQRHYLAGLGRKSRGFSRRI